MKLCLLVLILLACGGCTSSDCSSYSDEAAYVRNLSNDELNEIYQTTLSFFESRERFDWEGPLPEALGKHGIKYIRVHKQIHLRLNGCFDQWVDIVVFDTDEAPKMELRYGFNTREKIWSLDDV